LKYLIFALTIKKLNNFVKIKERLPWRNW